MKQMISDLWNRPASVRKFIAALLTGFSIAVAQGLVPEALGGWLPVVIAFAGAVGVYGVYNRKQDLNNPSEEH